MFVPSEADGCMREQHWHSDPPHELLASNTALDVAPETMNMASCGIDAENLLLQGMACQMMSLQQENNKGVIQSAA